MTPNLSPAESLDAYRDEHLPFPERGEFVVTTMEQAAWAARKLAAANAALQEVEHVANVERNRIADWYEEAARPHVNDVEFFGNLLTFWHETRHRENGDTPKTVNLPGGVRVQRRKQPDGWEFDADVFVPWAEENAPELVRRADPVPNVAEAKKALTFADGVVTDADGFPVQGVKVTPGGPVTSVKVVG